jgi:hypothetical protein
MSPTGSVVYFQADRARDPRGSNSVALRPEVDDAVCGDLHKVERDLSIEAAKALVGRVVANTLRLTGTLLKELGDKSQVGRWKRGEENPNLARLIQREDVRRAFALELLATCDGVEVTTNVAVRQRGRQ